MLMELLRAAKLGNNVSHNGRETAGFGYGFATVQNPVWTLSQVLLATGGRFVSGRTVASFRSISTDTRTLQPGDLFVALSGEKFDGLDFLDEAIRKGAAGVVVSRQPETAVPVPVVLVEDTLKALGDLAAYRRSQMADLQVIAITGSSGKTTVKEMTAAILEQEFNILKTQGNFNNLVGLPLSLLPVEHHHDVAVLEMGMNFPGEIARLTEIADPDIACITNVQDAHLAGLNNISGVARAKGELFAGIKAWGKLVVNVDDKRVKDLAKRYLNDKITFGLNRHAFVRATHVRSLGEEGMSFTLHVGSDKVRVKIHSLGAHNVVNALAAAAMAHAAGAGLEQIAKGLEAFKPYDKRMIVHTVAGGIKLVNDTYNANPSSVLAALETIHDLKRSNKVVAVLGDMLELGKQSAAAHRFVGETASRLGFYYVLAVGSFAGSVVEAARKAGMPVEQAKECASKDEVVQWLKQSIDDGTLAAGDWILVKGSRGMKMETIVAELLKQ